VMTQSAYAKRDARTSFGDGTEFILEAAREHPGQVTLIGIGPLFTVEAAIKRDPAAFKKLKRVVIMGGSVYKGYGVDAIGTLLEEHGIQNYLVEIGGEVRSRGRHANGHPWRIGIEKPAENVVADRTIQMVIELENSGLATSGTYRNYEMKDGKRIAHIIDPATGYPAQNSLLSVSVMAGDTMTADAYATALMVMGLDEGLRFVEARKDLNAYFIATDESKKLVEKRSAGFPSAANE